MPVPTLPAETWGSVFALVQKRTTLLSICKGWKENVESTPECWTSLTLTQHAFSQHLAVQKALLRSGSLYVHVDIPAMPEDPSTVVDLANTLGHSLHRVRSLSIGGDHEPPTTLFLTTMFLDGEGAPKPTCATSRLWISLEHEAQFSDTNTDDAGFATRTNDILDRVGPTLTALRLPENMLPRNLSALPKLTTLRFDGTEVTDVAHFFPLLLSCADSVSHLHISSSDQQSYIHRSTGIISFHDHYNNHPLPIALPALRTAYVSAPGTGTDVIRATITPALESLTLDGRRQLGWKEQYPEDSLTWVLGALLSRSGGNALRKLELIQVPLVRSAWAWLLHGVLPEVVDTTGTLFVDAVPDGVPFPGLEELVIEQTDEDAEIEPMVPEDLASIFGSLTEEYTHAGRLSLRRLTIRRAELTSEDVVAFCGRHRHSAGIEVVLEGCTGHGMQSHVEEGMTFIVKA